MPKWLAFFRDLSEKSGTAFSGLGHVLRWLPRGLSRLSLGQIRFTDLGHWRLNDYQNLTHLELRDCRHSGSVLKDAELPRLRHLTVRCTEQNFQDDIDHCIAFVGQAVGLTSLIIDNGLSSRDLTDLSSALEGRENGLQALLVDCNEVSAHVIPQWLSRSPFRKLKQLGIVVSDHDENTTLWRTIVVSSFVPVHTRPSS